MPTVFWTGSFEQCARRALELIDRAPEPTEVIFAFDGVPPPKPAWLDRGDVRIVATHRRSGPAIARNLAAQAARGSVLFFVDADVELATDALVRVLASFDADPDLVALFGAYDDEPAAMGVVSTFRNLLHHHTHAANPGEASTFWTGCGAVRTAAFLDLGGFNESFAHPSVEDIELGMRIAASGGRIVLDPDLRCKHLKRWTLGSMVFTDIVHRAAPWTRLILSQKHLPTTLNLDWRGRLGAICALGLAASLVAGWFTPVGLWAALGWTGALVLLNRGLYRLCLSKRGLRFAVASVALHWLYFVYSSLTFGVIAARELLGSRRATFPWLSRDSRASGSSSGSRRTPTVEPAAPSR
ncbi:MAG: hypothetical protein RLZZ111_1243 [Planctomycetota bacterium]